MPTDHPLRGVKKLAERALGAISSELDALYSSTGRPSIPPERLLKANCSSRCIRFVPIGSSASNSTTTFSSAGFSTWIWRAPVWINRISVGCASDWWSPTSRADFDEVVCLARRERLLSSDHFTVDGTLIEAWASFKSFRRKDGEPPKDGVTAPAWSISRARSDRMPRTRAQPTRNRSS